MWRRGEFLAPYCNFMRYFFTATAIIITDQLIKYEIRKNLSLGESIDIVRNLLEITHVVNKGGAWGIFSGFTLPLTVFSAVISVGIILFIAMSENLSSGMKTALTLIVSGGIGNRNRQAGVRRGHRYVLAVIFFTGFQFRRHKHNIRLDRSLGRSS